MVGGRTSSSLLQLQACPRYLNSPRSLFLPVPDYFTAARGMEKPIVQYSRIQHPIHQWLSAANAVIFLHGYATKSNSYIQYFVLMEGPYLIFIEYSLFIVVSYF